MSGDTKEICQAFKKANMPDSLLDICAKHVAQTIPFQRIEERYDRIPEPVQRRVVFWSFPRDEQDICMYSSLSRPSSSLDCQRLPFYRGVKLLESGCVENVLQVGFQLTGVINTPRSDSSAAAPLSRSTPEPEHRYRVSVSFDRCKITAVTCTCEARDIFWCQHVVALALYRIRNADSVKLRVPISETLLQMDRQQLQKFVQYLIAEHYTDVLPTAQRLADEILQQSSEINLIPGAPDPTAGGSADGDHSWHLDEEQVCEQVRSFLTQGGYYHVCRQLVSMFAKVREMLRARDSNGARMLALITEQFLADPRLVLWKTQGTPMTDKCRQLWDQLGALWVCVVLNPHCTAAEKEQWRQMLNKWSRVDVCPLEDPDYSNRTDAGAEERTRRRDRGDEESDSDSASSDDAGRRPADDAANGSGVSSLRAIRPNFSARLRTVFHRALDSLDISWDNPHLKLILGQDQPMACAEAHIKNDFNSQGQPLWRESLATACVRVDALRSHGYSVQSLRLAVAIVRNMKELQSQSKQRWIEQQNAPPVVLTASGVAKNPSISGATCTEGWIGHPLDPLGCLFDTLAEASLIPGEQNRSQFYSGLLEPNPGSEEDTNANPPKYQHVPVTGSADSSESYVSLAVEAAVIGLCQQRLMPSGLYSQEKACKQEERLLHKLEQMELDEILVGVLRRQALLALESGPNSGLGLGIHPESIPMHTVAKFLFQALLPHDPDLAYRVGLQAMRLPILEDHEDVDDPYNGNVNALVLSRYPRWFTLGHIEAQQCALASAMLSASKGEGDRLKAVLESAQQNIHSSSHLFKLAQDVLRLANPHEGPKHPRLLDAAFELGLQVMRMTLSSVNWRRREMVRWLVTCATDVGFSALLSIMTDWEQFFTPTEATGPVATTVMAHSTVVQLKLVPAQQEQLSKCARALALQCAGKDPPHCVLNALSLCENDPDSFEKAYRIVMDSASQVMSSTQLFSIARYMEHRGLGERAFNLALLAMKTVRLAYNQDSNPVISDVLWACSLSHSLGKTQLTAMVPVLVDNVKCATVLSDILRRCAANPPGTGVSGPSEPKKRCLKPLPYSQPPLKTILDAAINAYVDTTHSRLTHISPRHYGDFIEFLVKARETFLLADDGGVQFAQLVDSMKVAYKGKKKLMSLVKERFG